MAVSPDPEQPLLQISIGGEVARGSDAVDPPVHHDGDLFCHRAGHADVLFDNQHLDVAFFGQAKQHLLDLGDNDRREAFRGLVHDQETGVGQQGAGDRQHLLFAAGKLSAAIAFAFRQTWESRIDPFHGPGTGLRGHHAEMFIERERRPEPAALRHVADADPRDLGGAAPHQGLAGKTDRAAGNGHKAHDRLA